MARKKKSALLIIDMLNDFVLEGAPLEVPDTRKIVPAIRKRIAMARRRREPVIFVCDAHANNDREFSRFGWPPHAIRGTEGAGVVRELSPRPSDRLVTKKTYSAFFRTSLDRILKEEGVEKVELSGCVTNICILYAASEAVLRGYHVKVDEGLVAGLDRGSHNFALKQMKTVLGVEVVRKGG